MAGPVYKLFMARPTEAGYQLSEEERNSHMTKIYEALEKAGGKEIIACSSAWSSEEWLTFGIQEFPDIEAVQEFTEYLLELENPRYIDSISTLGTKIES